MTALGGAFGSTATRDAARAALAAARPHATPTDWRPLGRGNRKETALVTLADGDRVVVQAAADPAAVRSERALLDAVGERTSVPVPTALGAERVGDAAALVTEHVDGRDLHERFAGLDRSTQRALARAFGRSLAELHGAFRFERYGSVAAAEGSDAGPAESALELAARAGGGDDLPETDGTDWGAWLGAYGRTGLARLPAAFDDLRGDLAALFDDPDIEFAPPARLFPWDFRPGNALVADGELAAVLDWESPLAAAPALSLAKAEYLVADWYVEDPDALRDAFRAGYDSVRQRPAVEPVHRAAAICRTAVDSNGVVTNPGYPELGREQSVSFHRRALERALAGSAVE
ncbi:phosphotransferase [Halosimplex carlsbadense 2-9-1]|uniref:Phosphotransferase n=1 Tax=Halosimplex carlsbadense 2-9-1 TaxID=797114 RepID=M0D072_9EURY|nr:phosphotransferase [Halosimplex carlsbadense]ELZ28865.1 phosphotransferase [Halosimplex carlsbadense 2-9-1]